MISTEPAPCSADHAILNTRLTLSSPEETFPRREVSSLEERVFEDSLHSTESLDHVCPVVVQVPQLAIVSLMSPPERILLQHLITTSHMSTLNVGYSTFCKLFIQTAHRHIK